MSLAADLVYVVEQLNARLELELPPSPREQAKERRIQVQKDGPEGIASCVAKCKALRGIRGVLNHSAAVLFESPGFPLYSNFVTSPPCLPVFAISLVLRE